MVPKGWIKAPIKHYGDVCAGRQRAPSFTEGKVRPYLRVANVFDGFIDASDVNEMPFTDAEFKRYRLEVGDILLNEGQSAELVGRPAMYCGQPPECCFQNTLIRFKANELVDDNYALHRFRLCLYDGTFQSISKRTTSIAHLGVSRFADLVLLWPPKNEQIKIAKILSAWDKAIITTEQLLANSQQQKKALMQKLLTGKVRFAESKKRWKKIQLKKLLTEGKERNTSNSVVRVLSVTNHSGFVLPEDQFSKRVASDDVSNYKVVRKGQFGYNPSRINVGSFARLDKYDEGILSPMYVIFSVDESMLNTDYFLHWMSSDEARLRIAASTQGSVRESVGFDALCAINFLLPSLPEQEKISSLLNTASNEIDLLKRRIEFLKQEKKALMQQLLTGKRSVNIN